MGRTVLDLRPVSGLEDTRRFTLHPHPYQTPPRKGKRGEGRHESPTDPVNPVFQGETCFVILPKHRRSRRESPATGDDTEGVYQETREPLYFVLEGTSSVSTLGPWSPPSTTGTTEVSPGAEGAVPTLGRPPDARHRPRPPVAPDDADEGRAPVVGYRTLVVPPRPPGPVPLPTPTDLPDLPPVPRTTSSETGLGHKTATTTRRDPRPQVQTHLQPLFSKLPGRVEVSEIWFSGRERVRLPG